MSTYSAILSGQVDAESPYDTTLAAQMTNNHLAQAEGAAGAPRIQLKAFVETVSPSASHIWVCGRCVNYGTTNRKVAEIEIGVSGTYRIRMATYVPGGTGYYRIYKNGVALGANNSTTVTTHIDVFTGGVTEDLAFAAGDTLEIWLDNSGVNYTRTSFIVYSNDANLPKPIGGWSVHVDSTGLSWFTNGVNDTAFC